MHIFCKVDLLRLREQLALNELHGIINLSEVFPWIIHVQRRVGFDWSISLSHHESASELGMTNWNLSWLDLRLLVEMSKLVIFGSLLYLVVNKFLVLAAISWPYVSLSSSGISKWWKPLRWGSSFRRTYCCIEWLFVVCCGIILRMIFRHLDNASTGYCSSWLRICSHFHSSLALRLWSVVHQLVSLNHHHPVYLFLLLV